MFGNVRIKASKPAPKRLPSNSRFAFVRILTERCYRDPYIWGLIKCSAFFAVSVCAAKALCELNILPNDPVADQRLSM